MKWTLEREASLSAMWQRKPVAAIASELQTSIGSIYRQARKIGLKTRHRTARPLSASHPAVAGARPRYPRSIVDAETSPALLVEGRQSRKIGNEVTKGPWLKRFAGLRVFGYTAHDRGGVIGKAIMGLNKAFPTRCRIRFSGTSNDEFGAIVIESAEDSRHVLCPFETGGVKNCGACGLCWSTSKPIEFLRH